MRRPLLVAAGSAALVGMLTTACRPRAKEDPAASAVVTPGTVPDTTAPVTRPRVPPGLGRIIDSTANPGVPVEVRRGEKFTLVLGGNPSTGYGWYLADSSWRDVLRVAGTDYVQLPAPPDMVGVPGHEYWTFEPIAPGDVRLALNYEQAWMRGKTAPLLTRQFRVIVR